jgi:hypothetical protein
MPVTRGFVHIHNYNYIPTRAGSRVSGLVASGLPGAAIFRNIACPALLKPIRWRQLVTVSS